MTTSLDLTDDLIKKLDGDFVSLSQKLLGVQDDIQYRALTGTGGFNNPQLSGQTKTTVAAAKSTVGVVWILVDLVGKRITAVKAKRATVKSGIFSGIGGAAKELEDQLKLHNLTISDDVLNQLSQPLRAALLTEQPNATSVELVLSVGARQLNDAAKSIIAVAECQEALKKQIADTTANLDQVLPLVTKIGGAAGLAHRSAVASLATMKASLDQDPLGARQGFDKIVGPHITAINQALDQVQKAKEKAYQELGDAKVLMQRLEDRQPSPARTPELRDWLVKLAARIDQEEWATASQGLEDWIKEASGVLKVPPPSSSASNQSHQQPAHQPPPPPARHQPAPQPVHHNPPPPRVQQIPTSADYKKYEQKEKSNLEKLLDGELPTAPPSTPPPVERPADAAVEQLVSAQTQPSKSPAETQAPNHALDALVNGQGKQTQGHASGPGTAPPPNTALDALLNGQGKTPASGQTSPAATSPTSPNTALDDLLNGRPKQTPPPSSSGNSRPAATTSSAGTQAATPPPSASSSGSSLADLIDGKKPATPAATTAAPATVKPTAAPTSVPHTAALEQTQDPSKLTELFGEKKKACCAADLHR